MMEQFISAHGSIVAFVVGLLTLAAMMRQNGLTAGRMEKASQVNTERLDSHSDSIGRIELIVLRLDTLPEVIRQREKSLREDIARLQVRIDGLFDAFKGR